MKLKAVLISLVVVCCGLPFGMLLYWLKAESDLDHTSVAVEPRHITLDDVIIAGEVVPASFLIRNRGTQPIRVGGITSSCGCMDASLLETHSVYPFQLSPGDSREWRLKIDTHGRIGPQRYSATITGDAGGRPFAETVDVALEVVRGWHVEPSMVLFDDANPDEIQELTLTVYDGMAKRSLKLDRWETSDPGRMSVQAVPIEGSPESVKIGLRMYQLHPRYRLSLKYRPMTDRLRRDDFLELISDGAPQASIRIPIHCQLAPPAVLLSPTRVLLPAKNEATIERVVWCRLTGLGNDALPQFKKVPDNVTIRVDDHGGPKVGSPRMIKLTFQIPPGAAMTSADSEATLVIAEQSYSVPILRIR